MKKIIFAAVLTLVVFGCRKSTLPGDVRSGLIGSWELRKSVGGIAGNINYMPGNGEIIRFENETQYTVFHQSALSDNGTYLIVPTSDPDVWQLKFTSARTPNSAVLSSSIKYMKTQLIFLAAEVCCDIPTIYYERI